MWAAHVLEIKLLHEYSSLCSDTKPDFIPTRSHFYFFWSVLVLFQFRIQVQFHKFRILIFRPSVFTFIFQSMPTYSFTGKKKQGISSTKEILIFILNLELEKTRRNENGSSRTKEVPEEQEDH